MSKHHKRRTLLAGVAASALAASGHAFAADLSAKAPVYNKAPLVSPVHDWTGCYLGVHAGGASQTDTFTPASSFNFAIGGNGGGGLAGGQAGCNAQLGQIVLGVEGEGSWAALRDRSELEAFGGMSEFVVRTRWSADVALRAGVAVDRALIYGKVGAAWGRFDSSNLPSAASVSGTLPGFLLGGGIEYAFAPHWSARLEYDHVDYLSRQFVALEPFPISVTTNAVTAGVNYRFDDAGVAALARPAAAALYTKAPRPTRAYDWTGCYVGLHGGGETQNDGYTDVTGIGGLVGGQAGCNAQMGGIVLGVEGESAWTDTAASYTVNISGTTVPFQSTTRNRWSADAALRTGVAIDRALVYGKAGVAWGRFDVSASGAFVPPVILNASGTLTGLVLGGGIEYAFAPHWSAKLEFDHTDYASRVVRFNTNGLTINQSISATTDVVKAGVNYQLSEQSVTAIPPHPSLPSAAHDWTGCYAGIHAGAGTQTDSQTETGFIALIGLGNLGGVNGAGGLAGAQAGCNDQLGQIVLGVEGEGAWANLRDRYDGLEGFLQAGAHEHWNTDGAFRAGIAVDRALIYGKVGASWARFDMTLSFRPTMALMQGAGTLEGLLLGGGIEYAFAPHWSAKLEFDHVDYAARSLAVTTFVNVGGPMSNTSNQTVSAGNNLVKAGVNYQFGGNLVSAKY